MSNAIEVWLHQKNLAVTGFIVYEDEHTDNLQTHSLSVRGAEREITSRLTAQGYRPVGRWQREDDQGREVSRRFRKQ